MAKLSDLLLLQDSEEESLVPLIEQFVIRIRISFLPRRSLLSGRAIVVLPRSSKWLPLFLPALLTTMRLFSIDVHGAELRPRVQWGHLRGFVDLDSLRLLLFIMTVSVSGRSRSRIISALLRGRSCRWFLLVLNGGSLVHSDLFIIVILIIVIMHPIL